MSMVMVEGRDLLITMVIPQLGQMLSGGRLLGAAIVNLGGLMALIQVKKRCAAPSSQRSCQGRAGWSAHAQADTLV